MSSAPRSPISGFRRWVKQTPQPVALRCDGKTVLRIAGHSSRWSEAEKSVLALNCSVVEALNNQNEVLRVLEVREPEEEKPEPQKEAWPSSEAAQMAMIITAACDRAASRHEQAYKLSFDKLTMMFEAQTLRLEEAFRQCAYYQAELQKAAEKQTVPVPEGDAEMNQFIAQAMGAWVAQQANAATAKPNGNGKPKGAPTQ